MPFSPLPKTFLEDLHRRLQGCVVELGCADGQFSRLLQAEGVCPWRLDQRAPTAGSVADVVADALCLPLAPASVDLLVAANLLRHLWPLAEHRPAPPSWQQCLAPGGCLYIFEDEPLQQPAAARNYWRLQSFLARLLPESRRPLLPRSEFTGRLPLKGCSRGQWRLGYQQNSWPADPKAALALLRGEGDPGVDAAERAFPRGQKAAGEAHRLIADIARDGLSYGTYWWARWSPEAES